ncbi:MAG: hypothetical protein Q9163_006315 [Psora crenata]
MRNGLTFEGSGGKFPPKLRAGVTPKAITHRIAKLRSLAEENGPGPAAPGDEGTPNRAVGGGSVATPRPRAPAASGKSASPRAKPRDAGAAASGGKRTTPTNSPAAAAAARGVLKRTASGGVKNAGIGGGSHPLSPVSGVNDDDDDDDGTYEEQERKPSLREDGTAFYGKRAKVGKYHGENFAEAEAETGAGAGDLPSWS